eukprot:364487-Chlamydomonas_euryale.AAC.8
MPTHPAPRAARVCFCRSQFSGDGVRACTSHVQGAASLLPPHLLATIGSSPWDALATLAIPVAPGPRSSPTVAVKKVPESGALQAGGWHVR